MIKLRYVANSKYLYYQQLILFLNLPFLFGLFITNLLDLESKYTLLFYIIFLLFVLFAGFVLHKIFTANKKQTIEIDQSIVRVFNHKGKLIKEGTLVEIEQLQMDFEIDWWESLKRSWAVIRKKEDLFSRLKIKTHNGIEKLNFMVDSYYQLNKLKSVGNFASLENKQKTN